MMDPLLSTHSYLTAGIADSSNFQWSFAPDIPKDKQALAKATKDLMSLDPPYYPLPADVQYTQSYTLPPHSGSSSRTPTPTSSDQYTPHINLSSSCPRATHTYPAALRRTASYASLQPPVPPSSYLPAQSPPRIKPFQPQTKPALLSPSQKKANHIQSEQKRRANIRRGYEALCECIPALREAIRLDDTAADADSSRSAYSGKGKKARITTRSGKDGEDKIDGRAGPRSEGVVLSKTIDYINELLDDRRALLERLHRARSTLPPGHPALSPPSSALSHGREPLWEREWKGGQGNLGASAEPEADDSSSC